MEGERTNDQNNVLFISNLNFLTPEQEIESYFHNYHIKFIQILVNEIGQSRGSALVEFENSDQAIAAMNELNGTELHHRQIKIQKAAKKDIQSYRKFEMKHLICDINDECEYQKHNLFVSPINSAIENLTKLVASNAIQINNNAKLINNNAKLIKKNATKITKLITKIDKVITHLEDFTAEVRKNQSTLFNAINLNPIEMADIQSLDEKVKEIQ